MACPSVMAPTQSSPRPLRIGYSHPTAAGPETRRGRAPLTSKPARWPTTLVGSGQAARSGRVTTSRRRGRGQLTCAASTADARVTAASSLEAARRAPERPVDGAFERPGRGRPGNGPRERRAEGARRRVDAREDGGADDARDAGLLTADV